MIDNSMVLKLFFLCLTLIITLVFGLHPKDFGSDPAPFVNSAGHLSFTKYSVATTSADLAISTRDSEYAEYLTLDIDLQIPQMPNINNRFSVIFSINDGQGESQMLLGQWKNSLVLMSGDDYSNRNGEARITVPLDAVEGYYYPQSLDIHIRATTTYTEVFINDQKMARSSDYLVPFAPSTHTVSLGNTLNRKQGWTGTVGQFELNFSYCPSLISRSNMSSCISAYDIDLLKVLPATPTAIVKQHSTSRQHQPVNSSSWVLHPAFSVLSVEWLSRASLEYWQQPAFYKDVSINLLGFIPVSLAIFLVAASRYPLTSTVVITIIATATLSLIIETAQIFLPSRTSSIVDLTVNSLAGILTTVLSVATTRLMKLSG